MPRVRLLSRRRLVGCVALGIGAMRNGAAFAETTRERILRDHKLTLGIHNSSPWGFRGADGQVTGFHPDLVRAAFAPLGVTSVEFTVTDFGALIPGLVANRFDIVASGLGITPARCQVVAFSDPDLSIGDAIIVKAGNPLNLHSYADIVANPAVKLGASRGSANGKNAQLAGVPESRMLLFQNTEATFAALQAGRVDAITFSSPTAIGLLKDPNVTGIERALPFRGHVKPNGREAALYSALAFRQTDLDLRDLYDKRLAEMKADGTLAKLMGGYGFSEAEKAPDLTQRQICGGED